MERVRGLARYAAPHLLNSARDRDMPAFHLLSSPFWTRYPAVFCFMGEFPPAVVFFHAKRTTVVHVVEKKYVHQRSFLNVFFFCYRRVRAVKADTMLIHARQLWWSRYRQQRIACPEVPAVRRGRPVCPPPIYFLFGASRPNAASHGTWR